MGAAYAPEASAPFFLDFLDRVLPAPALQTFVQRFLGSCLSGDASDQAIMLLYGTGANGKSTLLDIVGYVLLGDYALSLPVGSLLHTDRGRGAEASPDLARLPGARLVTAAEPDSGARLSESQLKELTGGERVTVRHLHQPFFDFEPQFKLVLSFNEKPRVRGADEGIWRRLMLVPFEVLIPLADRLPVREMRRLMRAEAPGVLNWLIDGYRACPGPRPLVETGRHGATDGGAWARLTPAPSPDSGGHRLARGATPSGGKGKSKAFRGRHPSCRGCEAAGRVEAATIADHVIPHTNGSPLFWDQDWLQSACKWHHDSVKQQ